jgi:nicotinate phosphoribosyltransferase
VSLYVASPEDIKSGRTTDVYFQRTKKILEAKGKDDVTVVMEATIGSLDGHGWGVLCGVEEVAWLLQGLPVDVHCMPEGSLFRAEDSHGFRCPVLTIEGTYHDFCEYETPLLGFICQESAVASRAAYVRLAAGDKSVIAFGIRRIHPCLAPAMDRAAYIGGMDGVSSIIGAEVCGLQPTGTMPHALMIAFGDQVEAWRAYDEVVEPDSPRIILVDTYYDEKTEAIMAAEALGERLYGVRLDTPGTRRGSFPKIVREVRWELDLRGYGNVKIFVSGGLNENTVKELAAAGADAFGVGTWVSGAPTLDFAMDIVEVDGLPHAKRGKLGGKKQVWRCRECLSDTVKPASAQQPRCSVCGGDTEPMLKPLIKDGRIVAPSRTPTEIRDYVLRQLERLPEEATRDS